ncbi:MAG: DUF6273 domain-containing protein [Clostridia bacterium]|nr:DUF6273 domain-containing protein [Clostridia bacterium]
MKKVVAFFLAVILVIFATGLMGPLTGVQAASIPKASATKITLYVGYENYTIRLENITSKAKVTYKSSDEKTASVSNKGIITPVKKGNVKVTIQISQGGKSYSSVISVTIDNPYVTFAAKCDALDIGQQFNFQGKSYGLKNTDFIYSISDENVAVIDSKSGLLRAVGNGTVTVTVKDKTSGKAGSCQLTVYTAGSKEVIENKEVISTEEEEDPVARITREGNHVYFGNYPQTEIKGKALTDKIVSAEYLNGFATVNGVKIQRITYDQVTNFEKKGWKGYRYFKIEPIKWRILDSSDKELFLLAEHALDCAVYNDTRGSKDCAWENSTVRGWLNLGKGHLKGKEGFLAAAFTKAEQNAIFKKTIKNNKNSSYGTDGGKDTQDKVFLLSIEEASSKTYGFSTDKNNKDVKRIAYNTDYAAVMGAFDDGKGATWWTLRSPGSEGANCAIVYGGGRIEMKGMPNTDHNLGIRPAIRINMSIVVEK